MLHRIYILLLFFSVTLGIPAQGLQAGFGWGLVNFQNSVNERQGFNILEYEVKSDYRYGVVLKYKIPNSFFRFKSNYYYSEISGDGVINSINPSSSSAPLDVKTENTLTTVGLGLEYLVSEKPYNAYIGMDLLMSVFGDVKIRYFDGQNTRVEETYSSKTKIGLSGGGGISYNLFPGMDLDINVFYSSLNLLGKEDYEDNISTLDLTVTLLFNL